MNTARSRMRTASHPARVRKTADAFTREASQRAIIRLLEPEPTQATEPA
jgi:hypothetical protein